MLTLSDNLCERAPYRLVDKRAEDAGDEGEVDHVRWLGKVVDEGLGEAHDGGEEDDGEVVEAEEPEQDDDGDDDDDDNDDDDDDDDNGDGDVDDNGDGDGDGDGEPDHDRQDKEDADYFNSTKVGTKIREVNKPSRLTVDPRTLSG